MSDVLKGTEAAAANFTTYKKLRGRILRRLPSDEQQRRWK
jgi:hypothetical protein